MPRSEISKEQRRRYLKRKRDICIALGVCRECLNADAMTGIKMCKECADKSKVRNKLDKQWYKEHNICYICRSEKTIPGKLICVNCSKADSLIYSAREYKRKRVGVKKPKLWLEQGLCYQCGAPTLPGRKQCEKHYLISKAQADRLNADTSKHIWRKLCNEDVKRSRRKTK